MDELTPLALKTLHDIPAHVSVPRYDRRQLRAGIIHIGLGNFHRAHQAWYTHRLMQMGRAQDWAIIGAGVRASDSLMREKLLAQDCLTTLIELDPAGKTAEVTGAMVDFLPVERDNQTLIARMALADIRIVSLTVTEGGYYRDPKSGELDVNHPDIRHDARNPETPCTAFGAMVAALQRRRVTGARPFTGLSCDNLQGNGDILRHTIIELARMSDPSLAEWIDAECSFPNSMVDCIVPATGSREIALAHGFAIADAAPVTHERFRQWVIEDMFCAGRPDWDSVGAIFTPEVAAFEMMKLRILNGGHQVICAAGELLGLETIAACMAHPAIRNMFRKITQDEIGPHVATVPGITATEYAALIEDRFANPEILDTTRRVAFDGSSRHAGFLLPCIRDGLIHNTPIEGLALASALWARYCLGRRENGSAIAPNDPLWPELQAAAQAAQSNPVEWLTRVEIYRDVKAAPRFVDAFCRWARCLAANGTEHALEQYLA